MVNHVCEDAELFDEVMTFAQKIANSPPIGVRMIS
jgi:enoyl-CoA hydratase/carnithine racemase